MTAAPQLKLVPKDTNHDIDKLIEETAAGVEGSRFALASGDLTKLPPPGEPSQFNDLGNAERFLRYTGKKVLYVPEQDKWLVWSGTHWQTDTEDSIFAKLTPFVKSLREVDGDTKEGRQNSKRACDSAGISAIEKLSKRMVTKSITNFDRDPYLINCLDGTIDLRTGAKETHNPEQLITKCIDSGYDADREPDRFNWFLEAIQPERTVRAFIQRSIGYSLLGLVRERSFWIMHGYGKNGKSIFIDLFSGLLGPYASSVTTASIMQAKQSAIPNDIARLRGKRLIVVPETEENERLNTALIKQLAAGDTVSARFLFGEFFDFQFTGKLWIATNHKPRIHDNSEGFWDRLKLIPFNTRIKAENEIKRDELLGELRAEWPAILAWAVQGCRDYFDNGKGLDVPPVIQSAIDEYRFEQDQIAQFLAECCDSLEQFKIDYPEQWFSETEFRIPNDDMFEAYKKYCRDNGDHYVLNKTMLSRDLKSRNIRQGNSGGRYWEGFRLK